MTLGKSHNLFEPQFPHLPNMGDNGTCLRVVERIKEVGARHLTQGLAHDQCPLNSHIEYRIDFTCGLHVGVGVARGWVWFAVRVHRLHTPHPIRRSG